MLDPFEYNIRFFDDDEEGDAVAAAVVGKKNQSVEEARSDIEDEEEIEPDELAVIINFFLYKIKYKNLYYLRVYLKLKFLIHKMI